MPTDEEVVRTAADAAEGVIFDRYKQSNVDDVDVTVRFESGILEVDVYLNAPDDAKAERVAEEAAQAAQAAVDDLFAAEAETTDGAATDPPTDTEPDADG